MLDFGRVVAGPHCCLLLASVGAEVIKVERPGRGDDTRGNPYLWENGESAYFWQQNCGKKSVALDLRSEAGIRLTRELIRSADVLVENFRPGTMERLGLGWDELRELNPRLILCSISAYGQTGPDRDRPGYGALAEARAAIPTVTGDPDGPPMPTPVTASDFLTASQAFGAICAALYGREVTGRGEWIDMALLDCAVTLQDWAAELYSGSKGEVVLQRRGLFDRMIVPWGYFSAQDGWVCVIVSNDSFWRKLTELMGRPELGTDPAFATVAARSENHERVYAVVGEWVGSCHADELLERLLAADVPAQRVNEVERIFEDPQLRARGMFVPMEQPGIGSFEVLNTAIRVKGMTTGIRGSAPLLGEHSREVLEALGLPERLLEEAFATGAVCGAPPRGGKKRS